VFFAEVRFDGNGRKDHLNQRQNATEEVYEMYTSAETLPGFIVFVSKHKIGNDPAGTTYCVPVSRVMSCKVAERSLTQYQPLGTRDEYDTKSGNKKIHKQSKSKPVPAKSQTSDN
jgi:hypothetical protein